MTTKARIASLGPRDEVTLRRVALGYAERGELSATELRRLIEFRLVADIGGVLRLTDDGRRRYEQLTRPSALLGDAMPDELQRLLDMLIAERRR